MTFFRFSILSRSFLFASIVVTASVHASAQSTTAFGLQHQPLGQAVVQRTPTGQLRVSNLGSSGCDGVSIDVGGDGWDGYCSPVALPAGGAMNYTYYGSGQGLASAPVSGLRLSNDGQQKLIEMGFETASSYTIECYRDRQLVYRETGYRPPTDWWWIPVARYVLDHVSAHVEYSQSQGWSGGVDWNGAANITLTNGVSVSCDLLLVHPEDPTLPVDTLDKVEITAMGLSSFTIENERLVTMEHSFEAVDQALLTPQAGGRLKISNLGSSGCDGVSIAPPPGGDQQGVGMEFLHVDPLGNAPAGAHLRATSTGRMNGVSGSDLGDSTITKTQNGLVVTADFSPVGATSQRVEVYDRGHLVTTIGGHTGTVANVAIWPIGCGKRHQWYPWSTPCLFWKWDLPILFTIPGAAGGTFTGDELRVLAENAGGSLERIETVGVRCRGIPEITIVRTTALFNASAESVGAGCQGTAGVPQNVSLNAPMLGSTWNALLTDLPPLTLAFRIMSFQEFTPGIPLGGLGMPGCTQYVGLDSTLALLVGAGGTAGYGQPLPPIPGLAGARFLTQGAVIDPGANAAGLTTTNALRVVIGQ